MAEESPKSNASEKAPKAFLTKGVLWTMIILGGLIFFLGYNYFYSLDNGESITLGNLFYPSYLDNFFEDTTTKVDDFFKDEPIGEKPVEEKPGEEKKEGWNKNWLWTAAMPIIIIIILMMRRRGRSTEPSTNIPDPKWDPGKGGPGPVTPDQEDPPVSPTVPPKEIPKKPPIPISEELLIDLEENFLDTKKQNPYGSCAAFATCALLEYYLNGIKKILLKMKKIFQNSLFFII
ncbi:hypothetical protein J4209_02355 [Candidatus Woesearchaeota archaeon]|nr:hypothetical protein [Candidatus Woesearchaeota archaeon]